MALNECYKGKSKEHNQENSIGIQKTNEKLINTGITIFF
jgi:hypothetical protein